MRERQRKNRRQMGEFERNASQETFANGMKNSRALSDVANVIYGPQNKEVVVGELGHDRTYSKGEASEDEDGASDGQSDVEF